MNWLTDNPSFSTPFSSAGLGAENFSIGPAASQSTPMFDPLSAGITAAGMGIQGLFGAIGASKQANTQAAIANAQMAAQADSIRNARDIQKGNLGLGLFNTVWNSTSGPDLDFGRQLAAKRTEFAEFLPKQMGLGREQARWQTAFESSPEARELARRKRMGRLQETIAGYAAQPTGMFGPIRRINIEALAG